MSDLVSLEYLDAEEQRAASDRLAKRHRAETRFRVYGRVAIAFALLTLAVLFANIAIRGSSAFTRSVVLLEIDFDPELIDPDGAHTPESLGSGD